MNVLIYDNTLSTSLQNAAAELIPYTAPGKMMPHQKAHDLVIELAVLLKLAATMERELAVLRMGEPESLAKSTLEKEASITFDQLVRDPTGKVVKVDFEKGKKP